MVRVGNNISTPLILSTRVPQGCVLIPLLYSLFTHDFVAMHASNSIIKFADDTTVVGLITNNDEMAYREEGRALGVWCQDSTQLTLNVNKTKEMIMDFRKQQREHPPLHINGTVVERVESFKFFGVHITEKLKWSNHTDTEPLPVHPAIIQKARSVQVHQSRDRETEKQLISRPSCDC